MSDKATSEMAAKVSHPGWDVAQGTVERARMSRTVLFKMDTRLLPVLALLFLLSFLDRTNVGNAKILGLKPDLKIDDAQYTHGLAVYYATYIASEIPSNLVLKKVSAKIWLPVLTVTWGIITVCLGFVRGYGSFIAVRALLGFAEGGLVPGMILYLTTFYNRGELALRIGLFYTAASLSGAFGGLLARGLSAIGPAGGLAGWRWIMIMEGIITVVMGGVSYLLLPKDPATAYFLTEEERAMAVQRLEEEGGGRFSRKKERDEAFSWSEVRRGIFNLQVWLSSTAYFAILSGLYSFGLFLPTIVNEMRIAPNANLTQLWTVIPYAVATPITVLVAFLSDKMRIRGPVVLCVLPIAIVGYAIIAHVSSAPVRFGMTCLMAIGMYCAVPPILVWNANNSAGHYKRATTSALQLAVANAGGFVSTFVYPDRDGPYFRRGHTIILGLLCYAWITILANVLWCAKINRDKRNGKYSKYDGCGDDRDPAFIMMI